MCCRAYRSKFNQKDISNYAHDFFSNAVGAPAGPRFHKRRYSIFASASNEHFYCFILFYSLNFYERGFRKEDSFLLPASVLWHFLLYQIFNARTMSGGWRGGTGHTHEHNNLSIYDETKWNKLLAFSIIKTFFHKNRLLLEVSAWEILCGRMCRETIIKLWGELWALSGSSWIRSDFGFLGY